jgi:hypothetical protein
MLFFGHALADLAWQSDVMAKGKNRNNIPDFIPDGQILTPCWIYWLTGHALINGGMVFLITGNIGFGIWETAAHWIIDYIKCSKNGYLNPHTDQALHAACKLLYWCFS